MTQVIKYEKPFGPLIRIGMLQHQQEITFSLIGNYKIVRGNDKKSKITLTPEMGLITARLVNSTPANVQWRIVLAKVRDRDTAIVRSETTSSTLRLGNSEIIEVGADVETTTGRRLSAVGYWVCTAPYPTEKEAHEAMKKLPDPTRYELLPAIITPAEGTIEISSEKGDFKETVKDSFEIEPVDETASRVVLNDVIIGAMLHWRHKEQQKLRGNLRVVIDSLGKLTAVNILPLEKYLVSVNSSEMLASCPEEFLKVQTIASRNAALATMGKHHYGEDFDVCADEHCQCYRGSSRETENSQKGVLLTLGEIIVYGNEVCDTRYSKICGGVTEDFESAWHGEPIEYLESLFDGESNSPDAILYPANARQLADRLVSSLPDVFCNTTLPSTPPYLKFSAPYFRWEVTYSREQLEKLLNRFPQYSVGEFQDFEVLSRGNSGRIEYLMVKGTEGESIMVKEFEIRRVLSETLLYSSCFIYDIARDEQGRALTIHLRGAGWGHGVGMCQIGAAMMAEKGKKYNEILKHYYLNTELVQIYTEKYVRKNLKQELGEIDFRPDDACYEFFNCYAVAQCPVYLKKIRLEAQKQNGGFVFTPVNSPHTDLSRMNITCEFLEFAKDKATPKKGMV